MNLYAPQAIIDLNLLVKNISIIKSYTKNNIFFAVKGNAYGHGIKEISLFFDKMRDQVDGFVVGRLSEAMLLKNLGIQLPILVMDGCYELNELFLSNKSNIQFVLNDLEQIKFFVKNIHLTCKKIWVQIDIGMNYFGLKKDELPRFFNLLHKYQVNLNRVILFFHLPLASDISHVATIKHLKTINHIAAKYNVEISLATSGYIFSESKYHYHYPRVGSAIFGINPLAEKSNYYTKTAMKLVTTMLLRASVLSIRKVLRGEYVGYGATWKASTNLKIAIVGIGYGDGYPRTGAHGAPVLINGHRTHIVGKIAMDKLAILIPENLRNVSRGDWVTFWGPELSINEVAKHFKVSAASLFTGLNSRVSYTYIHS